MPLPPAPFLSAPSARPASGKFPFAVTTAAFAVVMLGTTLPTPLYAIYGDRLGFGIVSTTVIFAVYAAGVIAALIVTGRWSDAVGRRPLLLAGALLSAVSAVVFLTAGPEWQLIVGRILSGFSAGIYAGTATAAIIEFAPPAWRSRAPSIATAANIGGLGLGPLIAGLIAQAGFAPLHSPFVLDLILLAIVTLGLGFIGEPVAVTPGARLSIQRLAIPAEARAVFLRSAFVAFAGFAVMGTFTGVAPSFVSHVIGIESHAVAGAVPALLFCTSAATQIASRSMQIESALIAGCLILIAGVGVVSWALVTAWLPLLLVGAVISGIGQGMSFSKGLASVVAASPPTRRAEVTSTFFVVAYVAISVPVVGQGLAASQWGLRTAGMAFNAGVGTLAVIALILTVLAIKRPAVRTTQ